MNKALGDLEKFFHEETSLPTLIKVGLVHAQFETIHPFLDGNGRIGRLLITFIFCCEDILQKPLLYLSHFFNLYRWEYYHHLQKIRDEGDWESWLKFFLKGVNEVAQEATKTAMNIVQLRENHRDIVASNFSRSAGSAYQLLEYLYKRPIITVKGVAEVTDLSYQNANRLVMKFQEHGLLRQMDTYQRNRRFIYADYLAMFADEEMPKDKYQRSLVLEKEKTEYFTT
jgi:Fic family protein